VTTTELVNRSHLVVDLDRETAIDIVIAQANACWAQPYSFFGGDQVVVTPFFDGLTVNRWAPDLDKMSTKPMFKIMVFKKTNQTATVMMDEGACTGLCAYESFTADAIRWLNGDLRCKLPK
jgi:hypothetical protein